MMIRAVIFDLDGTLIQTEKLKAQAYALAAIELKPGFFTEQQAFDIFRDFVGGSREEVSKGLLKQLDLEEAALSRMAEFGASEPWQVLTRLRLQKYEEMIADDNVLKQAAWEHNLALLQQVREMKCKLGLATMSHCQQAKRSLSALGLETAFEFIATREDVENPKPDPEIYLLVAKALKVSPDSCLIVEDSIAGVKAAQAAGAKVLAVATPLTRRKLYASGLLEAHHIVGTPETLQKTLSHFFDHQN